MSYKKIDLHNRIIAFDADDTLWHNEINFRNAEREFAQAMLPFSSEEDSIDILMEVEGRNIPTLGYGTKTFIIALAEAAIEICNRAGTEAPNSLILKAMEIGKKSVHPKVELYPNVTEVLDWLKEQQNTKEFRIILATKGDLKDQEYKIEKSNLSSYFSHIEIMSEKDCNGYLKLMQKCNCTPENFTMIGNSFKSDIKPVIELGGTAIYIPSKIIWTHEIIEEFDHPNLTRLESISRLKEIFAV